MKLSLQVYLIILHIILLLFINFTKSDLPIHCLKHDIVGDWVIKATKLMQVNSGHDMKCGHNEPSKEETSYLARSPYQLNQEFKMSLKNNNEAFLNINGKHLVGSWTMVYDEGFAIEFNEYSFFAFSNYVIESDKGKNVYKSKCYSTCVGWYKSTERNNWGCYQAFRVGFEPDKITYFNTKNNLNIVEPNDENILNSMMNMQFKSINNKITFGNKFGSKKKKHQKLRSSNSMEELVKPTSFLAEQEFSGLKLLDASFNKHSLYISKLNTLKKSWNAGLHPNFSNMSIRELNKYAGIQKIDNHFGYKYGESSKEYEPTKTYGEDVSMFPKNFDWKDKLKPAGSQGNCGSCYVYSTIRMIEARLKIHFNHDVNLSVQHVVDCSIYNQGCSGGYPFLVMKFAKDFQLVPENCKPYMEEDGTCDKNLCDIKKLPYIYKTTDYKYVGGSYGKCSQKKMMEELKNGPIVVSFEPDYNFMMYNSGIYHSFDETTWINKGLPKPEWQKVDHSVLLVGWGEDDISGEKFWIIQNTWGPSWGEDGFFRMRRGSDEFGIESICEAANPIIVDNQTGLQINNVSSNYGNANFRINQNSKENDIRSSQSLFEMLK